MDSRRAAAEFLAPKVKSFTAKDWQRAVDAYSDAQCDEGLDRIDSMTEAFLALMRDFPEGCTAITAFNRPDWVRAEMAYREVYRLPCFKDLEDDPRIAICLQRALVTLMVGMPDHQYLPETAHETR